MVFVAILLLMVGTLNIIYGIGAHCRCELLRQ